MGVFGGGAGVGAGGVLSIVLGRFLFCRWCGGASVVVVCMGFCALVLVVGRCGLMFFCVRVLCCFYWVFWGWGRGWGCFLVFVCWLFLVVFCVWFWLVLFLFVFFFLVVLFLV